MVDAPLLLRYITFNSTGQVIGQVGKNYASNLDNCHLDFLCNLQKLCTVHATWYLLIVWPSQQVQMQSFVLPNSLKEEFTWRRLSIISYQMKTIMISREQKQIILRKQILEQVDPHVQALLLLALLLIPDLDIGLQPTHIKSSYPLPSLPSPCISSQYSPISYSLFHVFRAPYIFVCLVGPSERTF